MPSQRLAPDAIVAQTNLSGAVSDIQDDPDSADSNWLTAGSSSSDTEVRVSMPTPGAALTTGTGLQEFRVRVRKVGGSNTPSVEVWLYEASIAVRQLLSLTVTSTSGAIVSGTWNASELASSDGSLVEVYVHGVAASSGSPSKRSTVEVGAVEWNATIDSANRTASGGVSFAAPSLSGSATNTPPAVTGTGAVSFAAPSLAVSAIETFTGTGAASIAAPSLAGTAALSFTGTGGLAISTPALSASGTNEAPVSNDVTGSGALSLAAPVLAASGKETFAGSGAFALAKPSLAATGALSFSGSGGVDIAAPSIRGYQAAPVSSGPPRGSLTMMGLGG